MTWTPNVQVTTPYTGTVSALKASYTETCIANCQPPNTQEDWYFVNNLGPVRIDQSGIEQLELVDFAAGSGSPVSSFVSLRDALEALAGSGCCSSFASWSTWFTQATNLNAPSSAAVCLSPFAPSTFSADYYLSLLENVGSQSCTTISYPSTPNGLSANAMLQQVENNAGTTSGRDYDVWNYFYGVVEGQTGPPPESVCMKSVQTNDYYRNPAQVTNTPNRWMLLSGREWLLFYEYQVFGCAS